MACNKPYRVHDLRALYLTRKFKLLIKKLHFFTIRAKSRSETTKITMVILTIMLRIGRPPEVEL